MSVKKSSFLRSIGVLFSILTTQVAAQDDLGVARGFNAFVEQDFISQYTDVEGRLAAGGNVDLESYGIASKINVTPETLSLIAGGDITYNNGMIFSGSVLSGGSSTAIADNVRNGMAEGTSIQELTSPPFDFTEQFTLLREVSESLSLAESTGQAEYQYGGVILTGDCESDVQVFAIAGAELLNASSLTLECVPDGATIVFNVDHTHPGMQNIGLASLQPRANKILWNFFQAETVTFASIGVEGSILAPDAVLDTPWGYVNGTVMVKQWTGHMELHNVPFSGEITSLLPSEAPVIISEPVFYGTENSEYQYDVEAIDEDVGDVLTHAIDLAPFGFDIDPASGLISWQPTAEYTGTVEVTNAQCYVVPTGGVSIVEDGDEIPDDRVRVISPLFKEVKEALEISAEFTARESVAWDQREGCLGCHIQTQSLVGLGTSIEKIDVDEAAIDHLIDQLFVNQQENGTITSGNHRNTHLNNQTSLALWALNSYPDRTLTFEARVNALAFFNSRSSSQGTTRFWSNDHNTGWMNNAFPVTALVSQAGAGVLSDRLDPQIQFTDEHYSIAQGFEDLVPDLVEFFLLNYQSPGTDVTRPAFRLIGLSELKPFVVDANKRQEVDEAIEWLDNYLRTYSLSGGGWAATTGTTDGSPVASAWVGIALDYLSPPLTDPIVTKNIEYLLSTQNLAAGSNFGTWRDGHYFPGPNLAATSLVMSYLPVALDFLGNPDLYIGDTRLFEQGDVVAVEAVVGNRGIKAVTQETEVSIYAGTSNQSSLLGVVTLPPLAAGETFTASLVLSDLSLLDENLYFELALPSDIEECEIRNNSRLSAVVRHRVTDRRGLYDTQLYALSVRDDNAAPVITSSPEITHQQGQVQGVKVTVADEDIADAVTFALIDAPIGVYIDERTGQLLVDGALMEPGEYSFTVQATDLRGASSTQELDFTIQQNDPPEIISPPVQQVLENEQYVYPVEAVDPNGDELRFGLTDNSSDLSVHNRTGVVEALGDSPLEGLRSDNEFCEAQPVFGEFAVSQKWHWQGEGSNTRLFGPVNVVQLTDDNADGVINSDDIPDIVLHEASRNQLIALSGDTGEEIWRNDSVLVSGLGSPSSADIDGDGFVEIISVSRGRSDILAFEHTGELKWTMPANAPSFTDPRDSISIADLDQDGDVELILGRNIFDHNGNLIAQGNGAWGGDTRYGIISITADIDMDGVQEVIAGNTVYDVEGETIWAASGVGDRGFNAVGNFDEDDFPEIVLVGSGYVNLLSHTGELIWRKQIPGGGQGGAPTLADFDGDGELEIGVAGGAQYVTFEADGTLKWSNPTQDASSHRTGSSVFDFQGDGRAEVVYADETHFRIWDGQTGDLVYEVVNASGTTLEYPVIADIDNDGAAEVLYGGNEGNTRGLFAIESASDSWAPTRSIWNQHSYHITNINDDGTVPQFEQPSWLSHNTYRLNTFADRSALSQPDLAPFELKYDDNNNVLSAVVKNRGTAPTSDAISARFYAGSPDADGALLGTVDIARLEAGEETLISLDGISVEALTEEVFVDIQYADTAGECLTNNNRTSASVIQVGVSDEGGLSDTQTYLFSVINTNDAPAITSSANATIPSGQGLTHQVTVQDPDVGDAFNYSIDQAVPGITINARTGVLSVEAGVVGEGVYSVTIRVEDLAGAFDEQVFVLNVTAADNLPPEFSSTPSESTPALSDWVYLAQATDPEGEQIYYDLDTRPVGMNIDHVTGEIHWQPTAEQVGLNIVDVIAMDEQGASKHQRFGLFVSDPFVNNNPPQITSQPSGAITAGHSFTYSVMATDPDQDRLSYTLVGAVGNMSLDSTRGILNWLPDRTMIGRTFTVTIKVSDGRGGVATQQISLPVNEPTNNPPSIHNIPATQVLLGSVYSHQIEATDADGDQIHFSFGDNRPDGMTMTDDGLVTWEPSAAQAGHVFKVDVNAVDSRGATAFLSYEIAVIQPEEPNETPYFVSAPTSPAFVGQSYSYQAVARDADNDALTYSLVEPTDKGITFSETGLLNWTPGTVDEGEHTVAVSVSDGRATVTQSYTLAVVPAPQASTNRYPEIVSEPVSEILGGEAYSYPIIATDPDGDELTYELLFSPIDDVVLSPEGVLSWNTTAEQAGIHDFKVKVSDGDLSVVQSWSVMVWEEFPPLRLFLDVTPAQVNQGDDITLTVNTTGGSELAEKYLFVDGFEVLLDADGVAVITASEFGLHQVTATATAGEETLEQTDQFLVLDPSDSTVPVALIDAPEESAVLTDSVSIVGTAQDDNLVSWEIFLAPKDSQDWQTIASGTQNVSSGELGTLDPSLLLNGQYNLLLRVTDSNGQVATDSRTVVIEGDLKVGNFSFTVNDLTVPMVGIPIEINRTYDSRRRHEDLSFGYGWSIDYQNVRVDESRVPGRFWAINQYKRGPFNLILDLCVEPMGAPVVTVTLPTGEVERFEAAASPRCNTYSVIKEVELVFNSVGDTQSTLVALNDQYGYINGDTLVETGTYSQPINPSRYKLTTQAGYEYYLDQQFGIEKVVDPNGHTLTYTDDGIFHSSGKAVTFVRNAHGRITDVLAPNGTGLTYHYDDRADLDYVVDRSQATTDYEYNDNHGLLDIIDPLGRTIVKNLYDEEGRLYAQEDGNGVIKTFDHDLDANTSLVTDRDGRSTLLEYDSEGQVLYETQLINDGNYAADIVTGYTYDNHGNQETRTIGDSTWTADFDESNNQLFARDPEGHTVYYREYNARGQEGEIEDELGRISRMHYDSAGNLYLIEMPELTDPETGEQVKPQAGNIINARGLIKSTTDLSGLTTSYTYYPKGHQWEDQKWTESNPVSGTVTYTYDDNNNVKTETRERTVNGSVLEETVTYDYDSKDRLTHTHYPDGSYTQTIYDLAGNVDKERDRFGVWTDYTYDAYGRLTHTYYADGTSEIRTYTAEGLLETVTDRSGYVTRNEYDDAGRLWKVHNEQDGTYTETRYTLQGWVQYEWDEKRNLTEYVYDKSGRRTHTIRHKDDGSTATWAFDYYDNGELYTETDPLQHTTQHMINALDQRTGTLYHNGSMTEGRYDLMGRRTAVIDQNQLRTAFRYDDLGRLMGVTPEVTIDGSPVPETGYTYDEVGNQLTQTDANGHTTSWDYDYFGRVLTRTLPETMSEGFEYSTQMCEDQPVTTPSDAGAALCEVITHTDFNGDTITTVKDAMGRTNTVTYSKDGRVESYTYWPNDQVKTVSTPEGLTEYFYDERHRLEYEIRPNGVRMDYGYDDVGNRTLVQVTRDGVVTTQTSYTYDALNRLDTVTNDLQPSDVTDYDYDDAGNLDTVTYANGMVTDYDYNTVNQLTDVFTRDSTGELIDHYQYILDDTGRREVISELDGRTTAYCHDDLYRLTDEVIFDSPAMAITEGCISDTTGADYVANYEYDWVGNRTYETVDGVQTAYQYDQNDRLEQTGGTVYGYDDNGNTTTETLDGVVKTYHHDGRNKLIRMEVDSVVDGEYTYNHNGIRTSKTEGGATTQFIIDENTDYAQVLEEVVGGTAQVHYTYGHDLINQDRAGATSFYHYDGLGSTRALSDASGSLTDTYDYEAFGEVLEQTGETENSYLFTGEQFDQSLNQYYLRARYYDQTIGRFSQMDTWMGNNHDPITLHKYAYGNADPVTYVDPTGNFGLLSFSVANNIRMTLSEIQIDVGMSLLDAALSGDSAANGPNYKMIGLAAIGGPAAFKLLGMLSKKFRQACNSFDGETLVATEAGLVAIKDIQIGDKVWAYNEETGEKSLQEVVHLIQKEGQKELVDIELATGEVITATAGHPFFLPETQEWVDAGELTTDQLLLDLVGSPLSIASLNTYSEQARVYNLTVNNDHTYFVGVDGVLSHNINSSGPCKFIPGLTGKQLGLSTKITRKAGQQRHIRGSDAWSEKKGSYLNSREDAQKVLDAIHNGSAQILGKTSNGHILVKYNGVQGTNVNVGAGFPSQPTNVFSIKGTTNPAVVPTSPNATPAKIVELD